MLHRPFEEFQCQTCKLKLAPNKCKAYPDGTPLLLSLDLVPHTEPYEGDNGILYEPEE